uniref:Uncharacterized protein n=1 Tax=Romanomermis culicivorax TaxID=13658 RepID=A0A915IUK6_ROMCU
MITNNLEENLLSFIRRLTKQRIKIIFCPFQCHQIKFVDRDCVYCSNSNFVRPFQYFCSITIKSKVKMCELKNPSFLSPTVGGSQRWSATVGDCTSE